MNAIEADAAALTAASSIAEDALALHRDALAVLTQGWDSQSGRAATDLLSRQCGDAADLVAALQGVAADFRSLRDTPEQAGAAPDAPTRNENLAQTAARLDDRPQPSFATPAPAAAPQPMAWPSVPSVPSVPLPNLGGALVGLVTTLADALSPNPVDPPLPDNPPEDLPPHRTAVPPRLGPAGVEPSAPPPPVIEVAQPQANDPVPQPQPQPQPEPEPQPQPEPQPRPEPPLLAAERPVEPEPLPPEPPADPRTPCEIAADELPQVGQ